MHVLLGSMLYLMLIALAEANINDTPVIKNWNVNGVLSQGVIDADSSFVDKDGDISWDVREFTLNGQYRPLLNVTLAAQVQYRELGDLAPADGVELDHLLVDWRFATTGNDELGARAGRIKSVIGIYNDTRDMPFARPSIFLAHSIYSEALRDQYLRLDGAELYGSHYFDSGWLTDVGLSWGVAYGEADYTDQAFANIAGDAVLGSLDSKENVRAHLQLNLPMSLDLYFSYADLEYHMETDKVSVPDQANLNHWIAGFQWRWNKFELTSEYAEIRIKVNRPMMPSGGMSLMSIQEGNLSQTSQSYYFQGRYQFNPAWAGFIRYDMYHLDKNDRYGKQVPDHSLDIRSGSLSYARTRSIGVSYQPASQWLLMLEYHYVTGYGWVPPLFDPNESPVDDKNWTLIAAQVAYRFGW